MPAPKKRFKIPALDVEEEKVDEELSTERKQLMLAGIHGDGMTDEDLKAENWLERMAAAAQLNNIKACAKENGLSQGGAKAEIMKRIAEFMKTVDL